MADALVIEVYKATQEFPRDELFALTSQIRRAAVSVPSNIVEGCARDSETEYIRFLDIAFASLRELRYQINLSNRLGYSNTNVLFGIEERIVEIEKVIGGLIRSLKNSPSY